jgi:transposase-like protein
MPRSGPRTVRRYSDEFKLTAVRLSQQPGIQVQTVAAADERASDCARLCRRSYVIRLQLSVGGRPTTLRRIQRSTD